MTSTPWIKSSGVLSVTRSGDSLIPGYGSNVIDEGTLANTKNVSQDTWPDPDTLDDNVPIIINAIVEYIDMQYIGLGCRNTDNVWPGQRFDILNGQLHTSYASQVLHGSGIRSLGNNRYHIWAAFDSGAGATAWKTQLLLVNEAGSSQNYTGTNRSVKVFAVWIDVNDIVPAQWLPTTTAAATRRADRLVLHDPERANDFTATLVVTGRDYEDLLDTFTPWRNLLQYGSLNVYVHKDGISAQVQHSGGNVTVTDPGVMAEGVEYSIVVQKDSVSGLTLQVNANTPENSAVTNAVADMENTGRIYIGSNDAEQNHANVYYKSFALT